MYIKAFVSGSFRLPGRNLILYEPIQQVSHTGLARLIGPKARKDTILCCAANSRNGMKLLIKDHMTSGGSHGHQKRPGLGHSASRKAGMGVNNAGGNQRTRKKSQPPGPLLVQFSRCLPGRKDRPPEFPRKITEPGIQPSKEFLRITRFFLPEGLEARTAAVVPKAVGEHISQPVRHFQKEVRSLIDLRRLLQDLQHLGQHPLGGNLAAEAVQQTCTLGSLLDTAGLGRGRQVLPKLDSCMRMSLKAKCIAKRCAVSQSRKHRAGSHIPSDPGYLLWQDPCPDQKGRNNLFQYHQIIHGILQRPTRTLSGIHAVGIICHALCGNGAVFRVYQHCPSGKGAEIHTDDVRHTLFLPVSGVRTVLAEIVLILEILGRGLGTALTHLLGKKGHVGSLLQNEGSFHCLAAVGTPGKGSVLAHQHGGDCLGVFLPESLGDHNAGIGLIVLCHFFRR